jgi:predicted kinase
MGPRATLATMPTVHFVCGSTGSGKTTYSIALAQRAKAVRFSMDDWMKNLFLADQPVPASLEWTLERTARCEAQMLEVAEQLIARGIDVVFDNGLARRDHRDRFRGRVMQTVASSKLHYLDVPREVRRARVRARNEAKTGTYVFDVSDAMFDWMEQWFEPPTDDELYGAMIVCDG